MDTDTGDLISSSTNWSWFADNFTHSGFQRNSDNLSNETLLPEIDKKFRIRVIILDNTQSKIEDTLITCGGKLLGTTVVYEGLD